MDLGRYPYVGLDTETTGLNYPRDRAFAVGIATPEGVQHSYDFRVSGDLERAKESLRNFSGKIVCHNASFDYRMLASAGIQLDVTKFDCTAIRATLINEHEATVFPWTRGRGSFELDNLAKKYLKRSKTEDIYAELAGLFGGRATRNVQAPNLQHAPWEVVRPYVENDAELALLLWLWQEDEIEAQDIRQICDFERSLLPVVIRTEMAGVRVDLDYAVQAQAPIAKLITESQTELDRLAGMGLNVNSPKQIKEMFNPSYHDEEWWIGDYQIGTTNKGGPSLAGDIIKNMPDPRAKLISEIRSLIKTKETFLAKHVLEHSIDGRVYPNINQTKGEDGGTGTGRFSYSNPALQQIPSRNKEVAAIVKPCFLPDLGQLWADSDLASFEVRIFAHLVAAYDDSIVARYKQAPKTDFHQYVGDLTGLVRNATYAGQPNAKQLNLSMIFTQGNGATAEKMGLPWEWAKFLPKGKKDEPENYIRYKKAGPEAMAVIKKYHQNLPGVKKLADAAKKIVGAHGYIKTATGRKLRFPRGFKDYKSSGLLIQATAADENKKNWLLADEALAGEGRLILNTHDSYGLSLPEDWEPHYARVKEAIERETLRVPILLDFNGVGNNWWEALQGEA
jgi:DNA polymerase I-like protein with 3'-5' exonuclease and polymerase domains